LSSYSYLAILLPTGGATETTDTGTITLALTPSGVDAFAGVSEDSGTVRLAFTPSATEAFGYSDSATVGVLLTAGGFDTHLKVWYVDDITTTEAQTASFAVDMPPLATTGDLVIIHYVTFNTLGATGNAPSAAGWDVQSGATGPLRTHIVSKILDGSEGASVTFAIGGTSPGSTHNEVHAVAYRGQVALPSASMAKGAGSGTSFNPTNFTVAQDELLLTFITWYNNSSDLISFTPSDVNVVERYHTQPFEENLGLYEFAAEPGSRDIQGTFQTIGLGQAFQYAAFTIGSDAATETTDSGTVSLRFTSTFEEGATIDVDEVYLVFTPSGTDYLHVCKPRFRATLLSWQYDPEAMKEDWFGGLLLPNWHGELLLTEMAVNYDC
jgi:hypothetical protein